MAMPRTREARRFYRVAYQRLEDGQLVLDKLRRPAAAVYLAGYAAECMLKALILVQVPEARQAAIVAEHFRGARAHNLEWLRALLLSVGGKPFPAVLNRDLVYVATWSPEARYDPAEGSVEQAHAFIASIERIVEFLDARVN